MKKHTENKTSNKNANETVEVLYQKMGNRWFAFSMIDDEIFVGSISQEEINNAEKTGQNGKAKGAFKITGNS